MKKITLIPLISALSCSPFAFAGGMGDSNCCTAFFSLEGGYTVNKNDGYDFTVTGSTTTITAVKTNQKYAARLAAGILSMVDEDVGMTGELGWGYYGSTTISPPDVTGFLASIPVATSAKYTLSGLDALLGVAYIQPYYSLSFKAGALVQNMQINRTTTYTGTTAIDSYTEKHVNAAVLPEIKLGASYNINPNWAITGAYMLAWGSSSETTGNYNPTTGSATITVNDQNPTINALLIGVQYTI